LPPRADAAPACAALAGAARKLAAAGVASPAREARLLLAHAQGRDRLPDLAASVPERFHQWVSRRCAREPLALILGRQGFWTLELNVSRATLIPRPDSETLIEAALAAVPDRARVKDVLDLGTGTGALLLAALGEFSGAWGLGVDRSPEACALARDNAARAGLQNRSAFVCGDWGACLARKFDLVLVNPPYIRTADLPGLMPEVAAFEPALALNGGADGLAAYRALLPQLAHLLGERGLAVVEVGSGQAADVERLAAASGLAACGRRADLADIDRAVLLRAG